MPTCAARSARNAQPVKFEPIVMLLSLGSQPNYESLAQPAVWRTNRTMAAAKVDALASGGMDDFEIPAFLRRQAD